MRFNPFSILNNKQNKNPSIYYTPLLGRIIQSIMVLNGNQDNLGILDYIFVLSALTKLAKLAILTHIISIPKNIVAILLGIVITPITGVVDIVFKAKYKKNLEIIKNLDVEIKNETNIADGRKAISTVKLSELIDFDNKYAVDEYRVDFKRNSNDLTLRKTKGCYCVFTFMWGKAHEPSYSDNNKIKIPYNTQNKEGLKSILRVGAFFSEDLPQKQVAKYIQKFDKDEKNPLLLSQP